MHWHLANEFKQILNSSFIHTSIYFELIKHQLPANSRGILPSNILYLGKYVEIGRSVSCSFLFTGQMRFAFHLRLPACSVVPLTSKSQQEAT